MISSKRILLAAVVGSIIILGLVLYQDWAERNSRGTPPPALVCRMQLREIDAAKAEWALAKSKTTNDMPTWDDLRPYLAHHGEIPICPSGGTYTRGRVGEPPVCSIQTHTLR